MALSRDPGRRLAAACLALLLVTGRPALAEDADPEEKLAARAPSPWIAGILSAIVPGLGQFYAGERQRALFILGGGLALLTGTLVMNQVAGPEQKAGTTPDKPRAPLDAATFVLNMALPTYWAWNIGDAVRVSLPGGDSDVQASPSPSPLLTTPPAPLPI